jgi:hypothetical protein
MSAQLKLCITAEDLASAERFKIANPVLHKLQNTTGTLWRLCNDGLAMEIMPPFRATLLPLWSLRGWHGESENERALPCEIEMNLYPLQPEGKAAGAEPQSAAHPDSAPSDDAVQSALLRVLERNGYSSWRAVCPYIFAEQVEPFRTVVLSTESLRYAREWLQHLTKPLRCDGNSRQNGSTPASQPALRLPAKLYAPLTNEPVQNITIHLPPRTF